MAVYILHFSKKVSHAGHYIGFSEDPIKRLAEHKRGGTTPLIDACLRKGVVFTMNIIDSNGSRTFERKIKKQKNGPRYCPVCNNK